MSFKIKCPECGTKMSIYRTGRHGHWNCACGKFEECEVIGCNVCIDEGSGCDKCWYRKNDDGEDECDVDWGDRLCSGKDYCDKYFGASEGYAFKEDDGSLTQIPCEEAYLCANFFYHPVWKRLIHCPSCGSFDVNTVDDNNVWKFECLSCNEQFELNKNQNNDNDAKQKLIEQEEAKIALLKNYKELLDSGVLTEAEFEQKKKEVLGIFK